MIMLRDDGIITAQVVVGGEVNGAWFNRKSFWQRVEVSEQDPVVFVHDAATTFCPMFLPAVKLDEKHLVGVVTVILLVQLSLSVEADFDGIVIVAVGQPLHLLAVNQKGFFARVAKQRPAWLFQAGTAGKEQHK